MSNQDSGKFRIRTARQDDWDKISQISGEVSHEGLVADYITNIGPKYLRIGITYVIDSVDGIVGYHNIQEVPDGSVYLSGMRISGQYRKIGLASWLINETLETYVRKGKRKARAYIEPDNIASRFLFEKSGFIKKVKVHLYFGSMETERFNVENEWRDNIVDIGHLPSMYFPNIPARILRYGECRVSRSDPGAWDGLPTFTVLNQDGCKFVKGSSFIVSLSEIDQGNHTEVEPVEGFQSAFLYEKNLTNQNMTA